MSGNKFSRQKLKLGKYLMIF